MCCRSCGRLCPTVVLVAQRSLQLGLAFGDGLHQALRGLAGGCGQRDRWQCGQSAGTGMAQQHQQHAHDGGGLAGAGAAGEYEEACAGYRGYRGALPISGSFRHAAE